MEEIEILLASLSVLHGTSSCPFGLAGSYCHYHCYPPTGGINTLVMLLPQTKTIGVLVRGVGV